MFETFSFFVFPPLGQPTPHLIFTFAHGSSHQLWASAAQALIAVHFTSAIT